MTFSALKPWVIATLLLAGMAGMIGFAAQATTDSSDFVYWSDGDSGRLPDGTKFRLHGVDAPETGSLKQRGGAKCESERDKGYIAKQNAVELTRGKEVLITRDYGRDRYGRLVVDLEIEGFDVAVSLIASGSHKSWDYDGRQPKPDWCAARVASLSPARN